MMTVLTIFGVSGIVTLMGIGVCGYCTASKEEKKQYHKIIKDCVIVAVLLGCVITMLSCAKSLLNSVVRDMRSSVEEYRENVVGLD